METFGADNAYDIAEIDNIIPKLLANKKKIYYSLKHHQSFDERMVRWVESKTFTGREEAEKNAETFLDLWPLIAEQRLYKTPYEMDLIKKACQISSKAQKMLMRNCRPNKWEYELEGEFIYHCFQ